MCGYHVYQLRWTAVIGEVLTCRREPGSASDPFTVVMIMRSEIVGHVPRFYSCIYNLLLCHGRSLSSCITGNYRYSSDLPQGGLELPCSYKFSGFRELIEKLKHRLNELDVDVTDFIITISTKIIEEETPVPCPVQNTIESEDKRSPSTDRYSDTVWVKIKDITLTHEDR